MSIRKHGARWQVRLRAGSGQRIERSLPLGASKADALALETQLRARLVDRSLGRYALDEALERWIETYAKALKSWERDLRYRAGILRPYCAGQPLEALPDVADRLKKRAQSQGMTAPAVNRYLSLLRRIGNLAERWGWTDKPLGRRVVLLPESSQRHVYLTPAEVGRLANCADPLTADMIWFAALTGLRRGELLPLRPDQVRDGVITLDVKTKTGRARGVPMPPAAVRIAQERIPWGVRYWELRDRFEAARKAAGLPHVRWHDLRHTYASWIVQAGKPLQSVKELLGHSSMAMTARYAHLAPAHLRDAVAALPSRGVRVGTRRKVNNAA